MLLKVELKNFKSFKELTSIDFNSTNYKSLQDTNVCNDKILKGAIFVGSNASGKTNTILSLRLLLDMLFADKTINLLDYKSLLTIEPIIELNYEFEIKEKNIKYNISYDTLENMLSEKLYIDEILVLDRLGNNAKSEITESKSYTDIDNDILLLRTIYFNTKFSNFDVLKKWFEFLSNSVYLDASQRVISNYDRDMFLNKYLDKNGTDEINNFLNEFNFEQKIEYTNECIGNMNHFKNDACKMVFFRRKEIDEPIPLHWESLGNKNLLNMLPAFFNVIKNGGMLIIDEFSSAFHNDLERLLIQYFMEKSNNSQIFIVSHSTNLLSNSIFRPDQAYSVEFSSEGTKLKRFSDEHPRVSQNIEKMYLSGVFNGLPNYNK